MNTAVERCVLCGGVLGSFRVLVGGEPFHPRCSHDGRDHRIAELEAALKPFADAVYGDNGDVTVVHPGIGDYMRAKRIIENK